MYSGGSGVHLTDRREAPARSLWEEACGLFRSAPRTALLAFPLGSHCAGPAQVLPTTRYALNGSDLCTCPSAPLGRLGTPEEEDAVPLLSSSWLFTVHRVCAFSKQAESQPWLFPDPGCSTATSVWSLFPRECTDSRRSPSLFPLGPTSEFVLLLISAFS